MGASMFPTRKTSNRFAPSRDALRQVATAEMSEAFYAERASRPSSVTAPIRGG